MENEKQAYLAHVRLLPDGQWAEHTLDEHLHEVAKRAGKFAEPFNSADWAGLAGVWHDLGKYSNEFQRYIKTVSGYDAEAHIEGVNRVDHSTAGALYAMRQLGKHGRILAYLIAGHHAGLPDWSMADTGATALVHRLKPEQNHLLDRIPEQVMPADILTQTKPSSRPRGGEDGLHLWLRMLFSCLVDADFLDTEAFMDAQKATSRTGYQNLSELLTLFDAYMAKKSADAPITPVNAIRAEILRQCREKAMLPSGLFSLTVPQGHRI